MNSQTPSAQPLASLRSRLGQLRGQLRYYFFINGLNWTIAVGSVSVIICALLWALIGPPIEIFTTVAALFGLITLFVVVRYLLYPLTRRIPDEDLVMLIEREYPMLNDRLISALQLARYDGPAAQSPAMVARLTQEAEALSNQIDLREVLKPNRLAPMGMAAVAASLLLALTSLGISLLHNPWKMGIEVSFPTASEIDHRRTNLPRDLVVNYAPHQAEAGAGFAEKLIVAEGSDLVVRAKPRTYRTKREEFDIDDFSTAEVVIEAGAVRKAYPMTAVKEANGTGYYVFVERNVTASITAISVEWERSKSRRYQVVVSKPPRIDNLSITYHNPPHMRPRIVPIDPANPASPKVQIALTAEGGFVLEIPVLDDRGQAVREGGKIKTDTVRFANEAEFAAARPEIFRAHVRERIENKDTITGTEGTVVTFRLRTNKPLEKDRSYLGLRYKRADLGESVAKKTNIPLEPATGDPENCTEWTVSLPMDGDMTRYYFVLTDKDGLHQNDQKESPINVQPDQRPNARFVDTGVALKEGSSERYATPESYFPVGIEASDDFGLRSLRLLYQVNDGSDENVSEAVTMLHAIARFADAHINAHDGRLEGIESGSTVATVADALGIKREELPPVRAISLDDIKIHRQPSDTIDFYTLSVNVTPGNGIEGAVIFDSSKPSKLTVPDTRYEVPGFSDAATLTNFPDFTRVDFRLELANMLRAFNLQEDGQATVSIWIVAEDIKVNANTNKGQMYVSAPFVLKVISKRAMRAEIRFILRKVIKRQVEDMLRKQTGLQFATVQFRHDPTLLEKGVPVQQVFADEERVTDPRGRARMFTGPQAARMQDEITRSAKSMADRVDAIVRHYIYNDLEGDNLKAEQENTLQMMKILLLILSATKQQAMELNEDVKTISHSENADAVLAAVRTVLGYLIGDGTDYIAVRRGFDGKAFAKIIDTTDMSQAAIVREAALLYEEALSQQTSMAEKKDRLNAANELQRQAINALTEVLNLMRQWEGIDEHREMLRQLADQQRLLRDELARQAREAMGGGDGN